MLDLIVKPAQDAAAGSRVVVLNEFGRDAGGGKRAAVGYDGRLTSPELEAELATLETGPPPTRALTPVTIKPTPARVAAITASLELHDDPGTVERCRKEAKRWDWSRVGPEFEALYDGLV